MSDQLQELVRFVKSSIVISRAVHEKSDTEQTSAQHRHLSLTAPTPEVIDRVVQVEETARLHLLEADDRRKAVEKVLEHLKTELKSKQVFFEEQVASLRSHGRQKDARYKATTPASRHARLLTTAPASICFLESSLRAKRLSV